MNPTHIRPAVAAVLCAFTGLAAGAENVTLEEIVVTAQKRAERLVDVPVAITAVESSALTQENLVGIIDFYSRIPSLQYGCNKTYCLSLRGLTTGGANNPTIGILIDDIPFGSALQSGVGNSRFPDIDPSLIESIEVLRGPQGTLYGASSIGGLIKYVTRQPQPDQFAARLEAGMTAADGGSNEWNARGYVNLPFWSNKAAILVSGFTRDDPAYIYNVQPGFEGKDVNTTNIYGGSAAVMLAPSDGLEITLTAMRQKREAEFSPSIVTEPTTPGLPPTYVPLYGRDVISLTTTTDEGNQELYSGRIEWDIGGAHLTSLTSYSESTGTNVQDLSTIFFFIPLFYGYPPGSGAVVNINDVGGGDKFTQELRLSGSAGQVDWRVGAFYADEDNSVDQRLTLFDPDGALQAVAYDGKGPVTYEETAIFTDATWHLAPKWDLHAGLRYAENDQSSGGNTVIDGPVQPVFGPGGVGPTLDSSDDSLTFQVASTYHIKEDLMTYLRISTGYRPGGPNTDLPNVPASYDPDEVVNYEIGLKGIAADQRFSFDLAAFLLDWTDVQLQNTDATSQFTYTTNGGKAQSIGLEGSVQWSPLDGLTIGANATVLDATLTEDLPLIAGADTLLGADGDRLPGSAEFAANLSIQQEFGLTDRLTAVVGANLSYVGTRKSDFVNSGATVGGEPAERFDLPDYTLLDLRGGIATESGWRVDAFVRNATNEYGVITANNRNGTSTPFVVFLQPPTYGLSISKQF